MNPSAAKQAAAGNPKTPFPRTIPIARFALS